MAGLEIREWMDENPDVSMIRIVEFNAAPTTDGKGVGIRVRLTQMDGRYPFDTNPIFMDVEFAEEFAEGILQMVEVAKATVAARKEEVEG